MGVAAKAANNETRVPFRTSYVFRVFIRPVRRATRRHAGVSSPIPRAIPEAANTITKSSTVCHAPIYA